MAVSAGVWDERRKVINNHVSWLCSRSQGSVDCIRDVEVIETELLLKDADTVTKVLEGLAYVCAGMRGK